MKRKKIKSAWTEYFNFSARERRGAIFLSCLLIIQIVLLHYLRNKVEPVIPPDETIIRALLESDTHMPGDSQKVFAAKINEPISLFPFDPNVTDEAAWLKLGLSSKQIKMISKYVSKGGRFRTKNDFKKMYCISAEEYSTLEPFLQLPDTFVHAPFVKKSRPEKKGLVDIASADSITLESLQGIGPVLASRIIRYREKLGGFYDVAQIREVWGINDTLFQEILSFIEIKDTVPFRFIHLNTDTFGILSAHPYVKARLASLICNYRKQHKSFATIEELRQLPLVSEENFRKLAPYVLPD